MNIQMLYIYFHNYLWDEACMIFLDMFPAIRDWMIVFDMFLLGDQCTLDLFLVERDWMNTLYIFLAEGDWMPSVNEWEWKHEDHHPEFDWSGAAFRYKQATGVYLSFTLSRLTQSSSLILYVVLVAILTPRSIVYVVHISILTLRPIFVLSNKFTIPVKVLYIVFVTILTPRQILYVAHVTILTPRQIFVCCPCNYFNS